MSSTPILSSARGACVPLLAALMAALTACGPGGPKPESENTGGGSSGPTAGIALVAGNATLSGRTDANGGSARFNTPRGIAIDSSGNLYVADSLNYAIRKIAPDGSVSTFAGGLGTPLSTGTGDGNGTRARFFQPTALAIDAANNLFVLDGYAIRKITPAGDVSTLTTLPSGSGFGSSVQFQPAGIAIDSNGNLFVTTSVDFRRLSAASSYRSSAQLESGLAFDYGLGVDVLAPRGVAVDPNNVAWVADLGNTISRVPANTNALLRFAGTQGTSGSSDGVGAGARFGQVVALTTDKSGNLYAADAINFTIRKITSDAVTTTVAGRAGINSFSTGGLPGTLTTPRGIASDGSGHLYVTEGNAVVRITLP
jgi:streptogramin lyase